MTFTMPRTPHNGLKIDEWDTTPRAQTLLSLGKTYREIELVSGCSNLPLQTLSALVKPEDRRRKG